MSYRNSTKEPYQKLNSLWDVYKNNVNNINIFLSKIFYDGISKNCDSRLDPIGWSSHQNRIQEENEIGSKIFFLPCEYPFIELDSLLEITTPPELPEPMEEPSQITLGESEYPSYYREYLDGGIPLF